MKDDALPPLVKITDPRLASILGCTLMTKRSNAENTGAGANLDALVIEPYANPFRVYPLVEDYEKFKALFDKGVDCYIINTGDFLGKKTTTHYEFNGSIFKTITENEEGDYSAESYNTLGWLLEKESNDAFNNRYAISYEYNGIGQQVAVSTPHLAGGASQKVKRTEYDVYGRPTTITSPEGKITRFTYDKLKTTADDGQQQIISTRDAQGNIVEHQDIGGTVRYTYFANGNLKTADYSGIPTDVHHLVKNHISLTEKDVVPITTSFLAPPGKRIEFHLEIFFENHANPLVIKDGSKPFSVVSYPYANEKPARTYVPVNVVDAEEKSVNITQCQWYSQCLQMVHGNIKKADISND